MSTQHAIVGHPDEDPIPEQDWPAWSAGFEAGLAEGIARTRLRISVELVPVGPANAGLKLWRATTHARLTETSQHTGSPATGEQLREQAHRSWGLPLPQAEVPDQENATRTNDRQRPARVRVIGDLFHGRIPAAAVYIGRSAPGLMASPYANPHRVGACRICGQQHDQASAVAAFARDLAADPDRSADVRRDLTGRDLACWCRTDGRPCHGDVLLSRANPTTGPNP